MKNKALLLSSATLILILIISIPLGASAAVCPNLTSLGSLVLGGDYKPLKVAVDSKGNAYLADNFYDRFYVFDYNGKIVKNIAMGGPLSVAVDNAGKVYIGRASYYRGFYDGEVGVYDEDLNLLYTLGKGWKEFQRPIGLVVDDGMVYVNDSHSHSIGVYNATDGSHVYSFGGFGDNDGDLVFPVGLDVLHLGTGVTNQPAWEPAVDLISDNFDDGVKDPKWDYYGDTAAVSEAGGTLNIFSDNTIGTAAVISGYTSGVNSKISGDFDVSLDFSSFSNVGTGLSAFLYQVDVDVNNSAVIYRRSQLSTAYETIHVKTTTGGITTSKSYAYTGATGKFRIKREGTTIILYYDIGAGWVEAISSQGFSTADSSITIYALAGTGSNFSVKLDNFTDLLFDPGTPPLPVSGDRIYVADRTRYFTTNMDGTTGWGLGAGGNIFTKEGEFMSRFGLHGYAEEPGYMVNPTDLAIDEPGDRVIITDQRRGDLVVFDTEGTPVCNISLGQYTPFPSGVAVGEDGRLLVTVINNVFVFGMDNYVRLGVSPSTLNFGMGACGGSAADQNITISNSGPGVLNWGIVSDSAWLIPSVTSGSLNGVSSVNVSIGIDTAGIAAGTYNGVLTVSAQGASQKVAVSLTVAQPSGLVVSPSSFSFEVVGTQMPPADTLTVESDSGEDMTWNAVVDSPWIRVSPSSGATSVIYVDNVSIDAAGLDALPGGQHTGNITVSSACAAGGPVTVPVYLNYIKGGTIQVSTNFDGAEFTITGPGTYAGTGTTASFAGAPEGLYTVSFADAQGLGLIEPGPISLQVVNGQTTEFLGNYIDLRERNNIIATYGGAPLSLPDEIRIYDGTGALLNSITISPADTVNVGDRPSTVVETGDVDGDGALDLVVSRNRGVISLFMADGSMTEFAAFPYQSNLEIAAADFDRDGKDEIVVSSGWKSGDQPVIRVFAYEGGVVTDTGVNFLAYQKKKGAYVAASDVTGDGVPEIVTTQGGTGSLTVQVRIWGINVSGGMGSWSAYEMGSFNDGNTNAGADVATGDLDADGVDEIVISVFDTELAESNIYVFNASGAVLLQFSVPSVGGPVDIAVGDIDFDGKGEILFGNDEVGSPSVVRIYSADGTYRGEFQAFTDPNIYGVRVSLGQLMGE